MTFPEKIIARLLCIVARLVSGTVTRWVECEPDTRQRIYFANHSSHLDIVLLWSSLPDEIRDLTRPVAARDYWDKKGWRSYLAERIFRAILIDRPGKSESRISPLATIEQTLKALGARYSLIIFPEGTRGEGEGLARFKSGIYHLAKRMPGVELVPVYMENLNRILPKGRFVPVPLLSNVTFGPPLQLKTDENKHAFLNRLREALLELESL